MNDFGFTIHKDLLLDQDLPMTEYWDILEKVPSVSLCLSCGACAGTCISSEKTGMGFRKLILYLKNGMYAELQKGLESCQLCGKCWLVCPRGVNTRKAIIEMKKYFQD